MALLPPQLLARLARWRGAVVRGGQTVPKRKKGKRLVETIERVLDIMIGILKTLGGRAGTPWYAAKKNRSPGVGPGGAGVVPPIVYFFDPGSFQ